MRLKFLLRPGWLAAIALVVVFVALCFTVLAPWQFQRSEERHARNEAISASFREPPRPLDEVLPQGQAPDQSTEWKRVVLRGQYLPEGEVLAWQRSVLGEPAFEVLTPFHLTDGTTVLVDRGFIRPVESTRTPDFAAPPSGEVTLTARVRMDEVNAQQRPAFEHDGHRWVHTIDSRTVAESTGIQLRPGYFVLVEDQPGGLGVLPLPQLDSGPHFSYALQWITFGVLAIATVGYLIHTEMRGPKPSGEATGERARRRKLSVAEAIAEEERREEEELQNRQRG